MHKFFDNGLYFGMGRRLPFSDEDYVDVEIANVVKIDDKYYMALGEGNPLWKSKAGKVFLIHEITFDDDYPKSHFLDIEAERKLRPYIEKSFRPINEIECLNNLQKMFDEAREADALLRMGTIQLSIDYIRNGGWRRFQSNVYDV